MSTPDLYKASGVDTELGDEMVDWLQKDAKPISNPLGNVVSGVGGFAGLFKPNFSGLKDPILVSSTDGVGTKVILGLEHNKLQGLGIDLVAMCVNDLYTIGARPLFFLDYYATGTLEGEQFKSVLSGIRAGLAQCQTPLLGGETAELPGLYKKGDFDLAGFVVGVVDNARMLKKENVTAGSELYALASSGFHSNGYSLVRKWLTQTPKLATNDLVTKLLAPTIIYHQVPALVDKLGPNKIQALANITGSGISGNLPRVVPDGLVCDIDASKIPTPEWMRNFIRQSGATFEQVEPVFNLGAGMIAVIAKDAAEEFKTLAKDLGLTIAKIGTTQSSAGSPASVRYHGAWN